MSSIGKKPERGGPKPTSIEQNAAPILDLDTWSDGTSTTVAYHVGSPLTKIPHDASVSDIDSPDFQGGSLRVSLTTTWSPGDQLAIIPDETVTLTGTDNSAIRGIKINGILIGTVSGGKNGTDLVFTLHSTATPTLVETLLEHIGYANSADNPSTLPRTVTFTLIDGDGNANGGFDTAIARATITYGTSETTNVAPVLTGDHSADVSEGGSYGLTSADLSFSDPDDGTGDVTFTISNCANGVVKVGGVAATSFTGQQLLDGLVTFEHNGSEMGAASFDVYVEDGNEDGSTPTPSTFSFTVSAVNDAPTLAGDMAAAVTEGGSSTLTAADLGFSDPDDGASDVTFTVSNLSNGIVKVNGVAATSFTGQQLLAGMVAFVHDGSETNAASFNVAIEDGNEDGSAPTPSTFNLTVSAVNDPPVITGDLSAVLDEGGSYTLTAANLGFSDPDDGASDVTFTVSNLSHGLVKVNGVDAASFTGQQLLAGMVSFAHDGSETTAASFDVALEDGDEDSSAPTPCTFNFSVNPINDPPVMGGDMTADIAEGGSYTLTAADLSFSDVDDSASQVTFVVSNQNAGTVEVSGVAATSFTGQQLLDGLVTFHHDGSESLAASFDVSLDDGNEDGSEPSTNTFTFAVSPVNDPPAITGDLTADVVRGGSYTLKLADLGYIDPDDVASDVTFTVSNQLNGTVKVNGVAATSFTAQQLLDGLVKFTQDGSNTGSASFDIVVEDGEEDGSTPALSTFNFTVLSANIDLTTLSATRGFVIIGDAASNNAGWSVSSAGDVNGDGFGDLLVGAPNGNMGGTDAGQAYLLFGKADAFGTIDLAGLTAADGFIIQGDANFDHTGWSVSSAGDINGDGFDDIIVAAKDADAPGEGNVGRAYVLFGKAGGFNFVIDLAALPSSDGFMIQGDAANDLAGYKVSSAGDVNGDGFDDLIIGAPMGDNGGSDAGEVYVAFGKAAGFGTIDLTTFTSADGFIIQGDSAGDRAGWSVSSAGDVNGDGLADLIVGAPRGDNGGTDAGEAYVVFGKTTGFGAVLDLSGLSPTDGFIIQGDTLIDQAGISVSSAGDVNGDGFDDLIVGAPQGDDGGANAGEAYVVFGKASGFGTIDLTNLTAADGFIIQGDFDADLAGWSVSAAGDVNGDGFDDLIVGAPMGDNGGIDAGEAYVLLGKASGFGTGVLGRQVIDLGNLTFPDGFIIQGDAAGDQAGWSVSAAGDINNDGFADLIVGAPMGDDGGSNAGEAYVIFGSEFWLA
jgi:hypothetical protein